MRLPGRPRIPQALSRWQLPHWLGSLRARLLVATALIAVGAIVATAWLTSRGTTDRLRDDVAEGLGVDSRIYEALLVYAENNPTWDGVEPVVAELAESTGRRIALTTETGRVIVDSARLDGGGSPPLPGRPIAVVDALNPVGTISSSVVLSGVDLSVVEFDESGMVEEVSIGEGVLPDASPEEVADLDAAEDAIAACLDQAGVAYSVSDVDGVSTVEVDPEDEAASAAYDDCVTQTEAPPPGPKEWTPDTPDVVPESTELAPEDVERMTEEDEQLRRCLERRGIPHTTTSGPDGVPVTDIDYDNEAHVAAYDECATAAFETVNDELYADPARLYVGTSNRVGLAVLDAGRGPMLVAAGLVALLAVGVTVLVSRRLLRPVVALTDAAQRMAAGDLAHRVEVQGKDELSHLAHSFNSMADAIAANEEQRKRMVNDVAHELRNPLSNIRGYVEAALDGVTLADDKLLGSLHEDAILLQRLVDDLQTLALAEAGRLALHRKPVDVVELAATVVSTHQAQAEASGSELVLDAPSAPEAATVDGDPARLRQVIGNLVSNALRYTPEGGTVTVRVRRDEPGHVVVAVEDTGLGIADADLPHVFDRFWRADRSRTRDTGGSGLGLAITRELVTAHDGTIQASSEEGRGSTFTIRLPLMDRQPAARRP